jgi:hypothetical protein
MGHGRPRPPAAPRRPRSRCHRHGARHLRHGCALAFVGPPLERSRHRHERQQFVTHVDVPCQRLSSQAIAFSTSSARTLHGTTRRTRGTRATFFAPCLWNVTEDQMLSWPSQRGQVSFAAGERSRYARGARRVGAVRHVRAAGVARAPDSPAHCSPRSTTSSRASTAGMSSRRRGSVQDATSQARSTSPTSGGGSRHRLSRCRILRSPRESTICARRSSPTRSRAG